MTTTKFTIEVHNDEDRQLVEGLLNTLPDRIDASESGRAISRHPGLPGYADRANPTLGELEVNVDAIIAMPDGPRKARYGVEMHTKLDRFSDDGNLNDDEKARLVVLIDKIMVGIFKIKGGGQR